MIELCKMKNRIIALRNLRNVGFITRRNLKCYFIDLLVFAMTLEPRQE